MGNRSAHAGSSDVASLALRVTAGGIMAAHGYQKISAEGGVAGFQEFLKFLGLPLPEVLAYAVTALELVGGIMVIVGVLTKIPAALIAIEMLITGFWVKLVKLDAGWIGTEGTGAELDIVLFGAFLAIFLWGPGRYSVDQMLGSRKTAAPAVSET